MSNDDGEGSDSSTEIITTGDGSNGERPAKRRRQSNKQNVKPHSAPITAVIVSNDGSHAVTTTGEDKAIHVFSLVSKDRLVHLSQRQMTKRPCAVAFTSSGESILVGDKFGDVYALPLQHDSSVETETATKLPAKVATARFKPAATNLTVHSKRNLTALENQQRQAANPQHAGKQKDVMEFKHELLLGHVSMLTDIVAASCETSHGKREYIITADRDEHIRVSRGQPQAHIIENYCFGHTSFVSRLCLASEDILISGGGDDYLCVWDWKHGKLFTKLDLRKAMQQHFESLNFPQPPPASLIVSTLKAFSVEGPAGHIAVFCACEAIATIVVFELDTSRPLPDLSEPSHVRHLPAGHGNVLDLVVSELSLQEGRLEYRLVVSLDSLHKPNTKEARDDQGAQLLEVTTEGSRNMSRDFVELNEDAMKQSVDLFYGLEKLRKKGGDVE